MHPVRATAAALAFSLALAATGAKAAECEALALQMRALMLNPQISSITREKIDDLLDEAMELCERDALEMAETKLVNARNLLRSDLEG